METIPVSQFVKDSRFDGFLLVRAAEQRAASNGSKYLDMTLGDRTGEINAKMWDGTVQPPAAGTVVKIRAMMQEYNNRPQLRVDKLRPVTEKDNVDMSLLLPCAPYPPEDMLSVIKSRVERMKDEELKRLVTYRLDQCGEALMYYPAATRLHHAERSGLLHHTSTMLRMADAVCGVYTQLDGDLLAAGVILHDLCKITEIRADASGVAIDYSREGQLLGHIVRGVSELDKACEALSIREETRLMLEHMILSHHDLPEYGSPKPPMFPEAEVLHVLDLLDARMFEMDSALKNVAPGTFTERIWSLDRRLYRRERPSKTEEKSEE